MTTEAAARRRGGLFPTPTVERLKGDGDYYGWGACGRLASGPSSKPCAEMSGEAGWSSGRGSFGTQSLSAPGKLWLVVTGMVGPAGFVSPSRR